MHGIIQYGQFVAGAKGAEVLLSEWRASAKEFVTYSDALDWARRFNMDESTYTIIELVPEGRRTKKGSRR